MSDFYLDIESDKIGHFIVGGFTALIGCACHYFLGLNGLFGIVLLQLVAIIKEVHDYFSIDGTCDFNDYTATVAGGFLVFFIFEIFLFLR